MNVNRIAPDFATVTNMWEYYGGERDNKEFAAKVQKGRAQIMLAVTAPESEQRWGWKQLKANDFIQIASGLRTAGHYGHKYLYLWGKRVDTLPRIKRTLYTLPFASCGVSGFGHRKNEEVRPANWNKCLTVHRVAAASKAKIPQDFKLIAETKFARYYLENAQEIFKTLL